jgi:hypothetical protein
LVLSLASARAATLYVATTGSDSNPGTATQPFRTITYAYSRASAGTTISVGPGVYTDYSSGWGLHLGKSGTSASPITLISQVPGGAIIDGQNASDRNAAVYIDGSYNILQGFVICNGPNCGITLWGDGNQILRNEIHHNGNPASTNLNGQDGVYENEDNSGNAYIGNYIHDNGRIGGSNLDHGLYLCGNNTLVLNNVVIRNDSSGLQIAGYSTIRNMKVYNNVFAWNGSDGIIIWMDMSGVDTRNNIIFQNAHYGIYFYAATGSGVVMDHNLIYGNGSDNYSPFNNGGSTVSYTLGTTLATDPKFANSGSSSFDAHLSTGSPAVGYGLNFSSTFTTDMAGSPRPPAGPWDVGAYAYDLVQGGGPGPNVTVSASTPNATRVGPTNGVFVVTRSGDTTLPLTVNCSLGGTALNGVDYGLLGTVVIIPAGSASATVTVAPLPSANLVGSQSLQLTLAPDPAYTVSSPATATVTIAGNSVPSALAKASGNNMKLTWSSVAGRKYRVASKNQLNDPSWSSLSSVITATGTNSSYTDTGAHSSAQRFYLVYATN